MRRRRSSSRWSRKLMAVRPSWESSAGGSSAAISGIGGLGQRVRLRNRNLGVRPTAGGYGARRGLDRGKNGLAAVFEVELGNFGLDLCLELVRGPLEFIEGPPDLATDFGQFLGAEKDQGKQEEENHFWETQVHESMILPERIGGNRGGNAGLNSGTTTTTAGHEGRGRRSAA